MTQASSLEARPWPGLSPVRAVLANGVAVLAKRTLATPAVTVHVSVAAGSALDPPGHEGVAHFLSRLLDRGTASRTADEIAETLDDRGATLALSVNRHALSLVSTCLSEDLTPVLALVADLLQYPACADSEVATRRGEIATLIQQDADNPATVSMEGVLSDLYGRAHPYGRPARGTLESVARIDRDALCRFHLTWVRPALTTVAVVGDVTVEQATEEVRTAFGSWQADGPAPPTLEPRPPSTTRRARVVPMPGKAQADIAYGFVTVARDDPSYPTHALLNNILAQYAIGGRLGERIREREGLAYYVFSAFDPAFIPGPLVVRAGVNAANVARTVDLIDAEIRAFISDGPTGREMVESKQYLVGSLPRQLETNAAIAKFLVVAEMFRLGLDYELRLPGLLHGVTAEQVRAAAQATLDPSRATIVVAGPYDGSLV
jgi:zinc protease